MFTFTVNCVIIYGLGMIIQPILYSQLQKIKVDKWHFKVYNRIL